jgi:hypothetical protein
MGKPYLSYKQVRPMKAGLLTGILLISELVYAQNTLKVKSWKVLM